VHIYMTWRKSIENNNDYESKPTIIFIFPKRKWYLGSVGLVTVFYAKRESSGIIESNIQGGIKANTKNKNDKNILSAMSYGTEWVKFEIFNHVLFTCTCALSNAQIHQEECWRGVGDQLFCIWCCCLSVRKTMRRPTSKAREKCTDPNNIR
jgi:hypothetical protein